MAIRTDYTITDDITDGLDEISVAGAFDPDQDSKVVTLHQSGSEITMTYEMAREVMDAIRRVVEQ